MKKIFLIKNPELFQGKKQLNKNKEYFEGWYFKNSNKKESISFIPGISINKDERKAFIQVITNQTSYYIEYDINEFLYNDNPFYIKIGNNYFSRDKIKIDIMDNSQNLKIEGSIKYSNNKNISTSIFSPNIMGPFSYIPFMECNHAILSMKNTANGLITINNKKMKFDKGNGYIEKDWGSSFPKSYIWIQGNNFKNQNASFMLSIADIPFKTFNFRGLICDLLILNKEYKFTTYNNAKLIKCNTNNNELDITIKKGNYYLDIKSTLEEGHKLLAPVKGKMERNIYETISGTISITLKENNKIIFSDTSTNCGIEIVKKT